jgi:hypothetical protein
MGTLLRNNKLTLKNLPRTNTLTYLVLLARVRLDNFALQIKIIFPLKIAEFDDDNSKNTQSLKSLLEEISESRPTMAASKEKLTEKYVTIFMVVALYW